MQHRSSASWRQTLLSSLEACGFDSVDSVPGSARTEQEAHESAACDIFIALLLATPRSVKMVQSCFEGGWQTIEEIRLFAEHLQNIDQRVCSDACGDLAHSTVSRTSSGPASRSPNIDNDDEILQLFRRYFEKHATYTGNRSPLVMRNRLEELLPRRGLRLFVNRHLDMFEWINEKECKFCLRAPMLATPVTTKAFVPPGSASKHGNASTFTYERLPASLGFGIPPPPGLECESIPGPPPGLECIDRVCQTHRCSRLCQNLSLIHI